MVVDTLTRVQIKLKELYKLCYTIVIFYCRQDRGRRADDAIFRRRTGEQHWSKVLQVNRDCTVPFNLLGKSLKHGNGCVCCSPTFTPKRPKRAFRSHSLGPTGGLWNSVTNRVRKWINSKRKYEISPTDNAIAADRLLKRDEQTTAESDVRVTSSHHHHHHHHHPQLHRDHRQQDNVTQVGLPMCEVETVVDVSPVDKRFNEVEGAPGGFGCGQGVQLTAHLLQPSGISNRQLFRASLYKHRERKLSGNSIGKQPLTGTTSCPPNSAMKYKDAHIRQWRSCPSLRRGDSIEGDGFEDVDLPFLREMEFKRTAAEGKTSVDDFSISFSDLQLLECLRTGRRCRIYRGRWHGDVTVHLFGGMQSSETSTFWCNLTKLYRIRHENVILFMGACTDPPNMAVITSMPKGMSLYENIYTTKDKLNMHTKVQILQQISLGMGYLHAKGIVLRKLNTKNVFLGSKVKISVMDWGMSDIRHNRSDYASVPRGHLTYVAPEILCTMKTIPPRLVATTPYTYESDVFAFGTLMYEVMNGDFPYIDIPVESLIWQVGQGRRQCLEKLPCSAGLKTIIEDCWAQESIYRPDFLEISKDIHKNSPMYKKHSCSEPGRLHRTGTSIKRNW
ncbi:raf homolog serine/threonine-protein kinase-like [Gigantopelta aegis]|uniref:raf homolog serine/threonine-protein kinase-like n=1 Tax=Gigantopelta aegis TaxID=1735272 RepID=UPI001B887D6D|nr:raf homolog serine/threonine-protein kinase-like [Gigantopelta aegis]